MHGIVIYRLCGPTAEGKPIITWMYDQMDIATCLQARVSNGITVEILEYLPDTVPSGATLTPELRDIIAAYMERWTMHLGKQDTRPDEQEIT